jgi:uncharacterized protein
LRLQNETALAVYNELLLHTVSVTEPLSVDKFVFYSNYIGQDDVWNSDHYQKVIQYGDDLGEKMNNAFISIFQKAYDGIVIIGTDCPELNAEIIMNAFACLKTNEVVIGPAEDGGYYLIGLKEPHHKLFENIKWSTNSVLHETILKCDALQLGYYLLPVLNDIDEEKDLNLFKLQRQ